MASAAKRHTLKLPTRLMSMVRWKSAKGCAPSRPTVLDAMAMPAQFTAAVIAPNSDSAKSRAVSTLSPLVTSVSANRAASPNSATKAAPRAASRSSKTTRPPASTIARAEAAPRPEAPPLTSATV